MKYADAPLDAVGTTPLTGDALFASRGEHLLHFEEADRAAEWRKAIQQSNDEYTALIEQHTSLLQKIAASKRALLTKKRGGLVTSN